jgi:hypothetical protein
MDKNIEIERHEIAKKVFASQCDTIEAIALEFLGLVTQARSLEPQGTLPKWNRIDSMSESVDFLITARRRIVDSLNKL